MTVSSAERESRLVTLARLHRVWGGTGTRFESEAGDTVDGLIELCREWLKPDMTVVEVGSFAGVSTRVLACFAGTVYAVDPWTLATTYSEVPREMVERAEAEFVAMLDEWPTIIRVRGFSQEVARGPRFARGSLDAVYLDGDHTKVAEDVVAWLPKLKPSGLLMGHDWDVVGDAVTALTAACGALCYPDTSWVIRRQWVMNPDPC